MTTVIGVDVGGTFTDLVLRDESTGEVAVAKEPTTPDAPEQGVLNAVSKAVTADQLAQAEYFVHGTTVGLNALLERTGAKVGLLTTQGFRDVLEIRRGDRDDPYDLFWRPKAPIVPRRLRLEVAERMSVNGPLRPVEPASVLAALDVFRAEQVDSIAVVLLHSYRDPSHELEVERILRDAGWNGDLSLSHRVSGEYREYERTCTTVVDAFVRHRMGPYVRRLSSELRERGFTGELLITRSGGGAFTVEEAIERPFETILSGPVAGASASAHLARVLKEELLVLADVGGTSFDTALIRDARLPILFEGTVAGMPLQCPWVDVRSVGAGGGSIAHVDAGGLLRVGPRSAGAVPGPASYQRGGAEATTTDAALALGMLRPGRLNGGVELSAELAEAALARLAAPAGLRDAHDVAQGVIRIGVSHMAGAIRELTAESGEDPREATVVAFGGAGPMFGCLLAEELGAAHVIVPPNGGNFSAVGLVQAEFTRSAARTHIVTISAEAMPRIGEIGRELLEGIDQSRDDSVETLLDLRYRGQEHTLTLPFGSPDVLPGAADIAQKFVAAYQRAYSHELDEAVELVTVRVTSGTRTIQSDQLVPARPWSLPAETVRLWSFRRQEWVDAEMVTDTDLPSAGLEGPLLVRSETTTTYVDEGFTARRLESGAVVLTRKESRR